MDIASLTFAGFTLLTLILYYVLPRRPQNVLLLAASYLFYATWSAWYLLVLVALTAANYGLLHGLRREDRPRRGVLALALGLNLLALAVFKYADFFVPDLLARLDSWGLTGKALMGGGITILLPVGMSFYVVAVISYTLDVYRGHTHPPASPLDFALYMAYFPKLLAGPIERARDFLPRLAAPRLVDDAALARSMTLIVTGLVRKVIIADMLFQMQPDYLFSAPVLYSPLELSSYLIGYAFALYNDFAGYTAIARGISGLFGIELSRNFNIPYAATGFSDFWNRWHITLSNWLRDYIYYPTSRVLLRRHPRRDNIPNILLPPLLTMLISGLWHGTGWPMLLWGILHGLYLIGERVLILRRPPGPPKTRPLWRRTLSTGIVFGLVTLAWVPFAAPSLSAVADFWRGLLDFSNLARPSIRLLIPLLPALWLDWVQYRGGELVFLRWSAWTRAALLALVIVVILALTQTGTTAPFVYQGF